MLCITQSDSARGAIDYFTKSLSVEDYYSMKQSIAGTYHGEGAVRLGLPEEVTRDTFQALVYNRFPGTRKSITVRQKEDRRPGYDFTFNAPKSVSLLYAFTGDARIKDAFERAVQDTMGDVEKEAQTRVRKEGADANRTTSNLVWASWTHFTARPTEDGEKPTPAHLAQNAANVENDRWAQAIDPHLHSHNYVFNMTYDPIEERWKAGQFHDFHIDRTYYEAAFHARLARCMEALGYRSERHGKWWDVAGISREVIQEFSQRTAEIEQDAKDKKITDPKVKAKLGAKIRKAKIPGLDTSGLPPLWWDRMSAAQQQQMQAVIDAAAAGGTAAPTRHRVSAAEALKHAKGVVFARKSVVSDKELMEAALRYGTGQFLPEDITRQMQADGELIRVEVGHRVGVTTHKAHALEQAVIAFARDGRGTCIPMGLDKPEFNAQHLNEGQRAAGRHILNAWDRVILVSGPPGAGKTRMWQELAPEIERQAGLTVFAFAPSSDASRETLRQEGFTEADTVEHMLRNEVLQRRMRGQIIWIDEAGLLGMEDMLRVFHVAEKINARVVLQGDVRQQRSVKAGDAFRLLDKYSGLKKAELTEIVRQQEPHYLEATQHTARGEPLKGLEKMDHMGWVIQAPDEVRYTLLAQDYVWRTRARGSILVVAPVHREGQKAAACIRAELRKEGLLGAKDYDYHALRNLQWTEAEKADLANYRTGLIVQMEQNAAGFKRGARYRVMRSENGRVWLRGDDGRDQMLPLQHTDRFNVYEPFALPVAAGDKIRVTHNGETLDGHKLSNGKIYDVKSVTSEGDILLTNGWRIGKDFGHLATGFYVTSLTGQSKTVDYVFVAQSGASSPASSMEQWNVSVTRGRKGVRIFTDDKEALRGWISRSTQRGTATELLQGELGAYTQPRDIEEHMQRLRRQARRRRVAGAAQQGQGRQGQAPQAQPEQRPGQQVHEAAPEQRVRYGGFER